MSPSPQPQAVVKSRPTGVLSHVVMALGDALWGDDVG